MYSLFVCLILASIYSLVLAGSPCPPSNTIVPCKCSKFRQNTLVSCSFDDSSMIEQALERMSEEEMIIDRMEVIDGSMTFINSSFFGDIVVRKAVFLARKWSDIGITAFEGQEDCLDDLDIRRSSLTKLPVDSLQILASLRKLRIMFSEINSIEEDAFYEFQSSEILEILDLSHNNIRSIGDEAFLSLTNLRHLNLNGNKIKDLPKSFLPSTSKLSIFSIADNRVENINGVFKKVADGAYLNFTQNFITSLKTDSLRQIEVKMIEIIVEDNPFDCGCHMQILTITGNPTSIYGTCQSPINLLGMKIQELQPVDFLNCSIV